MVNTRKRGNVGKADDTANDSEEINTSQETEFERKRKSKSSSPLTTAKSSKQKKPNDDNLNNSAQKLIDDGDKRLVIDENSKDVQVNQELTGSKPRSSTKKKQIDNGSISAKKGKSPKGQETPKSFKRRLFSTTPEAKKQRKRKKRSKFERISSSESESSSDGQSESGSETDNSNVVDKSDYELEVSFEDDISSGATTEQETESSDSDDDGEDLNRRIAIGQIGMQSKQGDNSKSKSKVSESPKFEKNEILSWVSQLVEKQIKQNKEMEEQKRRGKKEKRKKSKKAKDRKERRDKFNEKEKLKREKRKKKHKSSKKEGMSTPMVKDKVSVEQNTVRKANSDSVIYTPGLHLVGDNDNAVTRNRISPGVKMDIAKHVTDVIKKLRVSSSITGKDSDTSDRSGSSRVSSEVRRVSPLEAVEDNIIEAEKQKAELIAPKGKQFDALTFKKDVVNQVPQVDHSAWENDGKFMQIDCHVDAQI